MTAIFTIVRSAIAACLCSTTNGGEGAQATYKYGWRMMLVLGSAACIIAQRAAMPPRQPCPAELALVTAQIMSG